MFISWGFVREWLYLSIGGFRGLLSGFRIEPGPSVFYLGHPAIFRRKRSQPSSQPSSCFRLTVAFLTKAGAGAKRDLYARFSVPEYWYVDLEAERVEVYALEEDRYPTPLLFYAGDSLRSPFLPGFSMSVEEALGA